jgi:hypothetical protein
MKPKDRPTWFDPHFSSDPRFYAQKTIDEFQRPEGWRTFDEDIPRWYDQWYSLLEPELKEFKSTPEDQPY